MAGEWRTATVRQLVDEGILERPIDGNHGEIHPKTSDFVERGIPFIMASDLVNGRVDTTHCAFISEKQARSLRKGFALSGDVLISHKATMGRTAIVDKLGVPFLMLTPQVTYYRVRDHLRLSNRYLKLYLDSPKFQKLFETWGQKGSTRLYLGITAQLDLPIVLPPPDEQRAIAHILGTLDDKIELNRRMNETLEAMAQAIFKSWFVDFDPVRAKRRGVWPYAPTISPTIADLFPDSFEDSELGKIPKGWRVRTVADVIQRLSVGKKYEQKTASPTGKVPVLDQGKTGIIGYHDGEPGVLASMERPIAVFANHTCYMRLIHFPFSAIQNVLPFVGKSVDTIWAFYATYGKQPFIEYKGHWPDFVIHKIVVPNPKLTAEFSRLVHPLLRMTWAGDGESSTLAALRDALLPKLISGEIRLKDVERFLKERGL